MPPTAQLQTAVHDCLDELGHLSDLLHRISDAHNLQPPFSVEQRLTDQCGQLGSVLTGHRVWIAREVARWGL